MLASCLRITIIKREGHALASICVARQSSDAFRLHQDEGVAQCYSCGWERNQIIANHRNASPVTDSIGSMSH
jgi:hypothetical protein